MSCKECGGTMVGDGYGSVLHCEYISDDIDLECIESDAGPIYCEYGSDNPYSFVREDDGTVSFSYGSQWIGTIKQGMHGPWAFYAVSNEYALSLNTLTAIHEYMKILISKG